MKTENKIKEQVLSEFLFNKGHLLINQFTIMPAYNSTDYNGNKKFVVDGPYINPKGFQTVLGAIKYAEKQ